MHMPCCFKMHALLQVHFSYAWQHIRAPRADDCGCTGCLLSGAHQPPKQLPTTGLANKAAACSTSLHPSHPATYPLLLHVCQALLQLLNLGLNLPPLLLTHPLGLRVGSVVQSGKGGSRAKTLEWKRVAYTTAHSAGSHLERQNASGAAPPS